MIPADSTSGTVAITVSLFGVTFINALLALVVFRAARREENRVFALLGASVAIWTLTNALFRTATATPLATFWAQLSYLSALCTAAAFLHFAQIYPLRRLTSAPARRLSIQFSAWSACAVITALVFIPQFVIKSVNVAEQRIITGPGISLVALFMIGVSTAGFVIFYGHQRRLRRRARSQARYVLFGALLTAVIGLTFNLGLPLTNDYRFVWLGPLGSLFFVGFTGYSIVAHRLFDIRVLIRRTLVYTLLLAGLAAAFAAFEKALENLLRPMLGSDGGFTTELLAALVVGFGVDPLKRSLHRVVTKSLFRGEEIDGDIIGDED